MLWSIFWSVAAHHSEAVDPDLIDWLKARLDHLLNLGPWTVVAILAVVILLIPTSIIAFYLWQQRRASSVEPTLMEREER